jgi:putative colanic acid biosynthesis acetyltransferase WcaF
MTDSAANVAPIAGGSRAQPVSREGTPQVDLSADVRNHSLANQLGRVLWGAAWLLLFRPSPRPLHRWRNVLLRLFGASLHPTAVIYPSARIWAPWNLTMGKHSCLANDVICYCLNRIVVGDHSVVSQYTHLCGGSHDYTKPDLPLITAPIVIEDQVWIAADVFIAPGVTIGQGTVVGARSNVFGDLPAWKVCAGSPAKPIKDRVLDITG